MEDGKWQDAILDLLSSIVKNLLKGGTLEKLYLTVACGDYDRTHALQTGPWKRKESDSTMFRSSRKKSFGAWVTIGSLTPRRCLSPTTSPWWVVVILRSWRIPSFSRRAFSVIRACLSTRTPASKIPETSKARKSVRRSMRLPRPSGFADFLSDDYGVRAQDMNWFLGGQEDPGRKERVKLDLPPEIKFNRFPTTRLLTACLKAARSTR